MEVVQLTLLCCRHAIVVLRHGWTRLAEADTTGAWRNPRRALSRFRADG